MTENNEPKRLLSRLRYKGLFPPTTKPFYLYVDASMYDCSETAALSVRRDKGKRENILTFPFSSEEENRVLGCSL